MLPKRYRRPRIGGPEADQGAAGDPEDVPTVDMEMRGGSFHTRRKWWQRLTYKGEVLETLTWDGERYIIHRYDVDKADLPREAVHVTGKKHRWFVDGVDRETRADLWQVQYDPELKKPNAIDVYLYAINTAFDEALLIRGKRAPMDIRRILTLLMVIGVGVCVAWVFIGPMLR